jgi:hypothetical protein
VREPHFGGARACSVLAMVFCHRELCLNVRNLGRLTMVRWEVRFGGTPKPARYKRALPRFRHRSRSGCSDYDHALDTQGFNWPARDDG